MQFTAAACKQLRIQYALGKWTKGKTTPKVATVMRK